MLHGIIRGLKNSLENIADFFEEYADLRVKIIRDTKRADELSAVIKKYMQDTGAKNYNLAASGKFLQEGCEVSASIKYPNKSIVDSNEVISLLGQEFFNQNATVSKKILEETLTEDQIDGLVKKVTGTSPTLNINTYVPQLKTSQESTIPDLGSFE